MPNNQTPHYAAVVVPFSADGAIDESGLRKVCQHVLTIPGITGVVVNAHAGEVDALSQPEREAVVRIAAAETQAGGKELVSGLAPVPASFAGAVDNAQRLRDAGADSLLVLGPSGFTRGVDAVPELAGEYVNRVYEAARLPIIYFLAGALSGIKYTPAVIQEICSVEGVVGVKDTMWSAEGFAATRRQIRGINPEIAVLSGNDNCVFQNFVSGADGTLLILNCVMGEAVVQMQQAVANDELAVARELNERYEALVRLLFAYPMLKMASRAKAALVMLGVLDSAATRLPVPEVSEQEWRALKSAMTECGLL
jgi:4-hydroxy-tetrahydrodipicolinate synthase